MPDPVWGTDGSSEPEDSAETGKRHDGPAPTFGAGPVPSNPVVNRPSHKPRQPEPVPDWLKSDPYADKPTAGRDPVAVAAVAIGFAGIVLFGVVLGIVAVITGALAGQRARESGRTYELPYLAMGLGVVDIVVWYVLRLVLGELPIWIG